MEVISSKIPNFFEIFLESGTFLVVSRTMIPLMLLDLWAFLINNSFLIKQNERIFGQIITVEKGEKTSILRSEYFLKFIY